MVNINIEIPDEIYKKVKVDAIIQDKTAKDYITQKIDEGLRRRKR
jgi:hypothetical protein